MRRVILIDKEESVSDYINFYSATDEIYTLQSLEYESKEKITEIMKFGPGDAVMIVRGKPFSYLKSFYHVGVRNENYYDCAKLYRLSIEGGAYAKIVTEYPGNSVIQDFLSPEFTKKVEFPDYTSRIIHTYEEAIRFLKYLASLPSDEDLGFDWEASGMPMDIEFEVSGCSFATVRGSAFISLTDIRHQVGKDSNEYQYLLKLIGDLILDKMDHIWTYNMQYEYTCNHRILGIDSYNLCDASVVNVIEGNHLKKYSLKWSGQYYLGVEAWDTEFDRISELIDSMLFTEEGKLKKDKHKVFKVDKTNFMYTDEWKELISRYPKYEKEFEELLLEYWNPFMCIPSEILGYYCNLDAFYTLMIYKSREKRYSKDCWQVNLDNTRLGCRIMSHGLFIDEPLRVRYEKYCHEMMAWGITNSALARCWIKMEKHKPLMADINKYNPVATKLLKTNKFYGGNILEITKNLLLDNLDTLDAYDTGLNEGKLAIKYGSDFAEKLIEIIKQAMIEVKFKGKIDETIKRKRKILDLISPQIGSLLGLDKLKLGKKHIELEKYLYYERAWIELRKICDRQLTDINNMPSTIHAFGKNMSLLEYSDYISENYFKCKSPIENDEIAYEFGMLFRHKTAFLAAMLSSAQQLPETTGFYEKRGITDINVGFNEMSEAWSEYFLHSTKSDLYPDKVFDLATEYYVDYSTSKKTDAKGTVTILYSCSDKVKEIWTGFEGWTAQQQLFSSVSGQYLDYTRPFVPEDLNDEFFFMRKFVINYLLYKKYAKLCSTYVGSDGMFKKNNKYVIEDEQHIPIRDADPCEPGAVEKAFVHYEVNTKSSKRWSSAFHTIISHSDCKDMICPPPSFDEFGNIIYGGSNQILSYFDISSAEVKSAGFASGDKNLIAKFNAGEDVYIYCAQLYLGESGWNALSKGDKKMWRKRFKTVFLGILYGLGKNSLAERLESSLEEAEYIIESVYKAFPDLRVYVNSQGEYPLTHDGYINTMLGDKLQIAEWEYLKKAKDQREKNNLVARIKRLGVNLVIQGGTSSIMASGFFNNIRISLQQKWEKILQPIIVVHDSNTNYIAVDKIFDIRKFYDIYYTDYCSSIGPKIKLLFDLMVGYSYESACQLDQIDENTISFSGKALYILKLYDKIMNSKNLKVECSMSRGEIEGSINYITHPVDRFIREKGCNMIKDESNITVQFHRL